MSTADWVLLRHGESTANRDGVYSGWQDVRLTPRGEAQARNAGAALLGIRFTRILSSDLSRAVETARLAAVGAGLADLPIQQLAGLRERNLGDWQGQDRARLKRAHPEGPLLRWDGSPPRGETLAQVAHRVLDTLIALPDAEGSTLLVAHGGVIRILTGLLDGVPRDELWTRKIPNAEPISIQVPPGTWTRLKRALPPLPTSPPVTPGLG